MRAIGDGLPGCKLCLPGTDTAHMRVIGFVIFGGSTCQKSGKFDKNRGTEVEARDWAVKAMWNALDPMYGPVVVYGKIPY